MWSGQSKKGEQQGKTDLKIRTVLFIEQPKDDKLAKLVRDVVTRPEFMLGFRIKVVERAGTCLKNILPNTNPWPGEHCSRSQCITCNQESEEIPDCFKRNFVYETFAPSATPRL